MPGTDIRVVIADDHPVVRDGLSALLGSVPSITVAGLAANGREAVQAAVTLRPDVLVMDVQMPELTGVDAAGEISRVAPDVAVLMLTMFDDDYSVLAAMRAGARGYVLKGAQQDEVVRATAAGAAGEALSGAGRARRLSIAPKAVANHISAIFTKLQIADRGEAIILARDAGVGRAARGGSEP